MILPLRPLFLVVQQLQLHLLPQEDFLLFLFGASLLVCPVLLIQKPFEVVDIPQILVLLIYQICDLLVCRVDLGLFQEHFPLLLVYGIGHSLNLGFIFLPPASHHLLYLLDFLRHVYQLLYYFNLSQMRLLYLRSSNNLLWSFRCHLGF